MSILVNRDTRLIVQGITGRLGSYFTLRMMQAGTNIVAGVTPHKGGQQIHGVPIFDNLCEAKARTNANATIVYVPPAHTKSALLEAIDAEMPLIICITNGVPVQDMLNVKSHLRNSSTLLIGPNTPGIITPNEFVCGFMVAQAFTRGPVGIMSRSGTLTYQTAALLSRAGIGQSTALGIGGDPVVGFGFADVLRLFAADDETRAAKGLGALLANQATTDNRHTRLTAHRSPHSFFRSRPVIRRNV